jgi:hypothetical protein
VDVTSNYIKEKNTRQIIQYCWCLNNGTLLFKLNLTHKNIVEYFFVYSIAFRVFLNKIVLFTRERSSKGLLFTLLFLFLFLLLLFLLG